MGYVWIIYQWQTDIIHKPRVPFCAFKFTTGYPCPSCGTTRSLLLILDGKWLEALWLNPMGFLGVTALVLIPIWLLYDLFSKQTTLWTMWLRFEGFLRKPLVYIPLIVLILLNWIWNIYKEL